MHEFSIAQSIVEQACAAAAQAGAGRITRVDCRVGELRQIETQLMQEAFAIARQDTLCAAAQLHIERAPLQSWCPRCRRGFVVADWNWICPDCGAEGAGLSGGDELDLLAIDVEPGP